MYNNYFEHVYSKFWKETSKKYGMEDGIDSIIEILQELKGETAFEVGIGTGWPLADSLQKTGVQMSGCDIAVSLIEQTKKEYPNMDVFAGTIWEVRDIKKGNFPQYDIVYCIRSSWYMKDFLKVIEQMLYMTKSDGYVVFNILNRQNQENKTTLMKSRFTHIKGRIEGALKVLLFNRDYFAACPIFYYTKTEVESVLSTKNVQWQVVSSNQLLDRRAEFEECGQKLLFIVKKTQDD